MRALTAGFSDGQSAALQAAEAVLWYLLLGRLAGSAGQVLGRPRVRVWLDRITATVFASFALRLAADIHS